jgi:hypothetical protein
MRRKRDGEGELKVAPQSRTEARRGLQHSETQNADPYLSVAHN